MKYRFILEVEDDEEDSEEEIATLVELALNHDLLSGMRISLTEYEED
jgi:hypothetical protein